MSAKENAGSKMAGMLLVSVYRSGRKDGAYVYLQRGAAYTDLPEAVRSVFGPATFCFDFLLTAQRSLAQASAIEVMQAIESQGFFLQLPPVDFDARLNPDL